MPRFISHPIQSIFETEINKDRFILLSDDQEDHPNEKQISENQLQYFSWHTVVMPVWVFQLFYKDWKSLKNKYKIPGGFLHSSQHRRSILRNDFNFIFEGLNLINSYNSIFCYFTQKNKADLDKFKLIFKNSKEFEFLRKNLFDLNNPKSLTLLFHLIDLDFILDKDFYKPIGYLFCDRIKGSSKNLQLVKDYPFIEWQTSENIPFNNISGCIAFKIKDIPSDDIGMSLDYPDFLAWCFNFTSTKLRLRDFADEKVVLAKKELKKRKSELSVSERKICDAYLQLLLSNKIKVTKSYFE